MTVDHKARISARQVSFTVIAILGVPVDIQRIRITSRFGLLDSGHLGIAVLCMGMLRQFAPGFFQCNGRKNQCVGSAEHYYAGKTGDNSVPASFLFVRFHISFCALQRIILHIPITRLSI